METNEKEPANLKRFSFGAFVIPFIWSIGSKAYGIAFITFIVAVIAAVLEQIGGYVVSAVLLLLWRIYLGFKGNSIAWDALIEKKTDAQPEPFQKKQKVWNIVALCILGVVLLMTFLGCSNNAAWTPSVSENLEPFDTVTWQGADESDVQSDGYNGTTYGLSTTTVTNEINVLGQSVSFTTEVPTVVGIPDNSIPLEDMEVISLPISPPAEVSSINAAFSGLRRNKEIADSLQRNRESTTNRTKRRLQAKRAVLSAYNDSLQNMRDSMN